MTTPTGIPSKEHILSTFDELVAAGIISFGSYRTIKHDAGGYPVLSLHLLTNITRLTPRKLEFRICPAFSRKPHTVGAKLDRSYANLEQWGPGSDLYCPDPRMKLAQLNGTRFSSYLFYPRNYIFNSRYFGTPPMPNTFTNPTLSQAPTTSHSTCFASTARNSSF
jgi:hypothetical protein